MVDYEKLTVVKLREELVKRGLPKTGLKAALVTRLVEADTESERATPLKGSKQTEPPLQATNGAPEATRQTTPPLTKTQDQYQGPAEGAVVDTAPIPGDVEQEAQKLRASGLAEDGAKLPDIAAAREVEPLQPESVERASNDRSTAESPAAQVLDAKTVEGDAHAVTAERSAVETTKEEAPATVEQPNPMEGDLQDVPPLSTQTSTIGGEELRLDSNKRKRRSQSPPPSSVEAAQKRAKMDEDRPLVKLPEDEIKRNASEQQPDDVVMGEVLVQLTPEDPVGTPQINGLEGPHDSAGKESVEAEMVKEDSVSPESNQPIQDPSPKSQRKPTPPPSATVHSPPKVSPSDTRFKSLFNASSKREGSPSKQLPQIESEDRVVSPALHPATSALYIRDFMRPLNPANLKDYLAALASPPDTDPDPQTIAEFFLDSIRTHCLVQFASTSAASRVRSGLHDRVWPDEKNRKPLWVDFVPEEKLKKWVEVESEAAGDRRQGMKKWEVVYEEEQEGVMAYLQEAGSNSHAPRSAQTTEPRTNSRAGAQGAPSGPRETDTDPNASMSRPPGKLDGGKAFGALDDLFPSTTTKPKLYYLPAARQIVDKRLDRLAAGRGNGRGGDEMRRYSFEDGLLVDKGPEFGMRGRGGFGARGGGYRGGYSGRGGYRGDAWRTR